MRLRITLVLLGLLLIALFLAGGASLFLVRNAAASDARSTVRNETIRLVAEATRVVPGGASCTTTTTSSGAHSSCPSFAELLPIVKAISGISAAGIAIVDTAGHLTSETGLPSALLRGADTKSLAKGKVIDGSYKDFAYAAAPLVSADTLTVALVLVIPVLTNTGSVSYFLLAGGISLAVATALAIIVTSRISRRVGAAAATAEQIRAGDLGARVALERRDLPELRALSGALNEMAASLESAQALERRFLLSISHDLRTPLTAIRGYAEAIADGATPEPTAAADVIVTESLRLQRLITDLLQLARLEARQFELDLQPIDLSVSVRASSEALALAFVAAEVVLEVAVDATPAIVRADADRIAQIVSNLLENALHFAEHRVRLALEVVESTFVLSVEDDGPGISGEDLPHLFDPLFTSGRAGRRPAGTGLGLAIVEELALAMGFALSVDSPLSPSGGTRFVLAGRIEAQHGEDFGS